MKAVGPGGFSYAEMAEMRVNMKAIEMNTASAFAIAGLLLAGSITLNPPVCRAGPTVVFRSGPRPVKPSKFSASDWVYHKVYYDLPGDLSDEPPIHVVSSQGWALRMRVHAAGLWVHVAGDRHFPAAWRCFAAYQLFMAHARPGEALASIASLCDGCPWLHRRMLRPAKAPLLAGSNTTAFSIRLASPGEPHARLLIAPAGKQSLSSVYQQLKGKPPTAATGERVVAIGVHVEGPEFNIPGLPQAARTFWLTAPVAPNGRPVLGQTLDRWAILHYVLPIAKASARRTAVVAALSMSEMPPDFWAALARDHALASGDRRFAVALFLVTGVKPGERLGKLVHAMHGFPPWRRWQLRFLPGGTGLPIFTSHTANDYAPYMLDPNMRRGQYGSGVHLYIALTIPSSPSASISRTLLCSCLNSHGSAAVLSAIVVDVTPHWRPYRRGYIAGALKAAMKLRK